MASARCWPPSPWCAVVSIWLAAAPAAAAPVDDALPPTPDVDRPELDPLPPPIVREPPDVPGGMSVAEAVREALRANLDIAAKRFDVPIAASELTNAKLRLNPVLSLGADHLDLLGTGYDKQNAAGPQEFFVRADVPVRVSRKRRLRMQHARAARSVAERDVADAERRLRLAVQHVCVDVQLAEAELVLARDNAALFASIVELNETRVAAGDLPAVELARTRIAEVSAINAVRTAEAELARAKNRLARILGRSGTGRDIELREPMRRDPASFVLRELEGHAIANRPDYQAQQRERERSEIDIRRQLAEGKVDVSFGVEARRQQGLAGRGNSLGLFFAVPLPIFARNQGEVERARQQNRAASAELGAVAREIKAEVDDAYMAYELARDLLSGFEGGLLEQSQSVLETVAYSYRRGEASLVQLIDAQRAYNETRAAYNDARAEYARALYTIEGVSAKPPR